MNMEYVKDFCFAFVVIAACLVAIIGGVGALVFALNWLGGPPAFFGGMFVLLCAVYAWRITSDHHS